MKTCRYCEQKLELSFFTKDKSQPDNLSRGCRTCSAEVQAKHKAKVKFHRKSRMKKNVSPVIKRARMVAWIKDNPGEALKRYNEFIERRPGLAKSNGWKRRAIV